ncbi:uncharacterized, partial [Tachysurus ichikawai]
PIKKAILPRRRRTAEETSYRSKTFFITGDSAPGQQLNLVSPRPETNGRTWSPEAHEKTEGRG